MGDWSTKKRDKAPRGVFHHRSGDWAIRYTCGAGHIHKERVGRLRHFLEVNRTVSDRRHRIIIAAPKSGKSRRVDVPTALLTRWGTDHGVAGARGGARPVWIAE